jgi:hypothetical protein
MAITGINNNPLELMISKDKNIADFSSSIKAGDTLRGKVIDVIAGENKAIINFKGYNIIAELPSGAQVSPGDVINVQVSMVNDQIFMKLLVPGAELGKGGDMPAAQHITPQQIVVMLNNLKVPVNEQNVFIAQKLIDYHIPVTSENISEVNTSLNSYLENKGIDARSFNVQTPQAAVELIADNMFKLNFELDNAVNSSVQTQSAAGESKNNIIQQQNSGINVGVQEKINNIINTITSVNQGGDKAVITEDAGSIILTIKDAQPSFIKNLAIEALRSNSISAAEADTLVNDSNLSQPAAVASGTVTISKLPENGIEIKFTNMRQDIEQLTTPAATGQSASVQASGDLKVAFNNILSGLNQKIASSDAPFSVVYLKSAVQDVKSQISSSTANLFLASSMEDLSPAVSSLSSSGIQTSAATEPNIANTLNQQYANVLQNVKASVAELNKAIFEPGDTNMPQNVKEIARQILQIDTSIRQLNANLDAVTDKTVSTPAEIQNYKNEISSIMKLTANLNSKVGFTDDPSSFSISPKSFTEFQTVVKQYAAALSDFPILKQPVVEKSAPQNMSSIIDVESAIESITFLKSRNIAPDNTGFIDTMSKYFKNDMKLNQNMESLNTAIDKFTTIKNQAQAGTEASGIINNITQMASKIKTLMQQISLNPTEGNLKQDIIQDQFKNFLDNAGLNTENRMKSILPDNTAPNAVKTAVNQAKETLKAELINLSNEVQSADTSKMSSAQKQSISDVRDKANDILTNMNAIQFINVKPVSYEMLYTQIPVFLNNRFFNGELQVWFRKGSLKENYEKSMPVNFVFMLNTSNMGNVKISMTVYKNDVECNVTADSEKAKQALIRGKNDFLKSMDKINFNIKNFNIALEKDSTIEKPASADGYVNLGRINLEA